MEAKLIRLYTGSDGESHFEDMNIPLQDYEGLFEWSEPVEVQEIIFQEASNVREHGWHNAPRRQFIITLAGSIEIEVGDGSRAVFGAGDVLLAEDMTGRGHITRPAGKKSHRAVIATLK